LNIQLLMFLALVDRTLYRPGIGVFKAGVFQVEIMFVIKESGEKWPKERWARVFVETTHHPFITEETLKTEIVRQSKSVQRRLCDLMYTEIVVEQLADQLEITIHRIWDTDNVLVRGKSGETF
jgi:hypothetical protein